MEHRIEVVNKLGTSTRAACLTENLRRLFRTQGLTSVDRPVTVTLGVMGPDIEIGMSAKVSGLFISGVGGPRVDPRRRYHVIDTSTWCDFDIMINPRLPTTDVAETLAHESVHICQFVTGRYRILLVPGGTFRTWEGELVPADTTYHNMPWEREAHAMQVALGNTVNL